MAAELQGAKARLIGPVNSGDDAASRAIEIGDQKFAYAEVRAFACGNPAEGCP
jgi:hypothetical protein